MDPVPLVKSVFINYSLFIPEGQITNFFLVFATQEGIVFPDLDIQQRVIFNNVSI